MNEPLFSAIKNCSGKITLKGIVAGMTTFFVLTIGIVIFHPPLWWQKIVNPWDERDHAFCSKRYDVCVSNKPEWSVMIPPRDFLRKATPIISFLALHFVSEQVGPNIEAMVIISPPENLKAGRYEVVSPMDYLLMIQKKNRVLYKDYRVVEPPANGIMNGHKVAFVRATFNIPGSGDYDLKMFAFTENGKGYGLLYRTSKGQFDQYQAEAMKIIESFRFGSDLKA